MGVSEIRECTICRERYLTFAVVVESDYLLCLLASTMCENIMDRPLSFRIRTALRREFTLQVNEEQKNLSLCTCGIMSRKRSTIYFAAITEAGWFWSLTFFQHHSNDRLVYFFPRRCALCNGYRHRKIESATWAQALKVAVRISLCVYAFGKGMRPSVLSPLHSSIVNSWVDKVL